MIDPQFAHTVTNRFHVAWIPACKAIDASSDHSLGASIAQTTHPFRELNRAANFDH
jgi:hypothetical protein